MPGRRRTPRPSPCAALFAAAVGWVAGLPALRLKGIYLAIATLAFNVIVEEVTARWEGLTGGNAGLHLKPVELAGLTLDGDAGFHELCLALAVISILAALSLLRSPTGRAFVAIRDSEISASCLGVNLATYKTLFTAKPDPLLLSSPRAAAGHIAIMPMVRLPGAHLSARRCVHRPQRRTAPGLIFLSFSGCNVRPGTLLDPQGKA